MHDVLAHLVDVALTTPTNLATTMLRAGMNLDKQNQNGMLTHRGDTPEQTLEAFAAVVPRTSGPPTWLAPLESRLVEEIAHGEDIRRPLGLRRDYPVAALTAASAYLARTSNARGGAKDLARRVTLRATDHQFEIGSGPLVEGPLLELFLILSGRPHDPAVVTGPGLAELSTA